MISLPPVAVRCQCGVVVEVPSRIECHVTADGRHVYDLFPDYVDLYAHVWTHEQSP